MKSQTSTPMKYEFDLGKGNKFSLELPRPLDQMTKKERAELAKHARKFVDSVYYKYKLEAKAKYQALLDKAQQLIDEALQLKEDYEF